MSVYENSHFKSSVRNTFEFKRVCTITSGVRYSNYISLFPFKYSPFLNFSSFNTLYVTLSGPSNGWSSWSDFGPCDSKCYKVRQRFCGELDRSACKGATSSGLQDDQQKCPDAECNGKEKQIKHFWHFFFILLKNCFTKRVSISSNPQIVDKVSFAKLPMGSGFWLAIKTMQPCTLPEIGKKKLHVSSISNIIRITAKTHKIHFC